MESDNKARLKQWLATGEARLQPLTFPQRELWETSPVPVSSPSNHICGFIEIKGGITPQEAEKAIQRVVDRQEALRVSFLPGKERPLQMIRATGSAVLEYRELSSAEAKPEALEELMMGVYKKPFDMMQGPLHRVEMLKRGTNDHLLAFSIHHAIADGWSLGVFIDDLRTAYVMGLSGFRKAMAVGVMGLANSLPPVPQTYSEWGAAERAFWTPEELARRASFWKSQLNGSRRLWDKTDGSIPARDPLQRWATAVPAPLTRAIRDLATQTGSTLFSTLLTMFQMTLSKWTGKDDILVGTPVADRNKELVRQTMGYFAGIVPLRGQVDWEQPVLDRLRDVQENTTNSFSHAMPFAELASALCQPRATGEHTLFDVRFALQNHPIPDVVLPRISTKLRMRSTGTPRFDLGCEITEMGAELEVVWLYQPQLFSLANITELNVMLQAMMTSVCRSPESRGSALRD